MINRRQLLVGGAAALTVTTLTVASDEFLMSSAQAQTALPNRLSVEEAHQKALSGEITLIDIRRPDEWAGTGSGEGAVRLDMRRQDFIPALLEVVTEPSAPIALICARGVRSAWLTDILTQAGFTNIIDVPEGMLGSAAGAGWLGKGLPVVR